MRAGPLPPWPFLLAAAVALVAGLVLLFAAGSVLAGILVLLLAAGLGVVGVSLGRAVAAEVPPQAAPAAEAAHPAEPASVKDYTDEGAVRSAMKWKRTCKECGSPVLEKAKECPTCGSTL